MVENIPLDIAQIGQQETHMHHICTKNNQHPNQEVLEVKEIHLDTVHGPSRNSTGSTRVELSH